MKFDLDELEDLKNIFVDFSVKHRGMDFESFQDMISFVYGIYRYPFAAVRRWVLSSVTI